jgi:hypothetical protein
MAGGSRVRSGIAVSLWLVVWIQRDGRLLSIGGVSRRKDVIRLDAGRPRFHTGAGFGEEAARDAMMGV